MFRAYFSINHIDFVSLSERCLTYVVSLFFLITLLLMVEKEAGWFDYLKCFNNIFGIISFVGLSSYFVRKGIWKSNNGLLSYSFLIYAYHGVFSERALRFFFLILNPKSEMSFMFIYFTTALILVLGGVVLYNVLIKISPRFASLITGRR